jgi:hypothetical protein
MIKQINIMVLMLLAIGLMAGCAGTMKTNTARTLISIHDGVKISADAADALCDQRIIKPAPCAVMKTGYDAFKVEWPKTVDALKVYLQTPATTGQEQFATQYELFMTTYNQLFTELVKNGVIKMTEGVK